MKWRRSSVPFLNNDLRDMCFFVGPSCRATDLVTFLESRVTAPNAFLAPQCSPRARLRRAVAMSSSFAKFLNSPTGPKTTHFWGPVANWGFVLAGLEQTTKPEHMISGPMTGALTVYSGLFMRFAWRVQPRNYILLACHTANGTVQVG